MFKRDEFDSLLLIAQSHLDRSADNPIELHNALTMMMNAMRKLADSCENDLGEAMESAADAYKAASAPDA